MKKMLLFLLILCGGYLHSSAQVPQRFFTGIFPELSLTRKVSDRHKLNFKVENQRVIFDNLDSDSENPQFSHYRTDIMAFFDRSLKPGMSLALWLFHRFQENEDGNRIIQQFALTQKSRAIRVNHRFRTDQTFTRNQPLEVRFRYRLSLEVPLQGAEIDPGEYYFLTSGESIFSRQGSDFEIENRLAASLGKFFNKTQKLEWGVDYRTDGYIQDGFRTRLWAKISFYYNF